MEWDILWTPDVKKRLRSLNVQEFTAMRHRGQAIHHLLGIVYPYHWTIKNDESHVPVVGSDESKVLSRKTHSGQRLQFWHETHA